MWQARQLLCNGSSEENLPKKEESDQISSLCQKLLTHAALHHSPPQYHQQQQQHFSPVHWTSAETQNTITSDDSNQIISYHHKSSSFTDGLTGWSIKHQKMMTMTIKTRDFRLEESWTLLSSLTFVCTTSENIRLSEYQHHDRRQNTLTKLQRVCSTVRDCKIWSTQ